MAHKVTTEETPFGHKAVCSCGGYTLGFFPSATRAKRAMMNSSHGDKAKPKVQFVEVEGR